MGARNSRTTGKRNDQPRSLFKRTNCTYPKTDQIAPESAIADSDEEAAWEEHEDEGVEEDREEAGKGDGETEKHVSDLIFDRRTITKQAPRLSSTTEGLKSSVIHKNNGASLLPSEDIRKKMLNDYDESDRKAILEARWKTNSPYESTKGKQVPTHDAPLILRRKQ